MSGRKPDFRKAAADIAAERAANAMAHPDAEDLVAFHSGDLPAQRVETLLSHLGACRDCCEVILELDRVEREERRPWTVLTESVARATDGLRNTVEAREASSDGWPRQISTLVWRSRAFAAVVAAGAIAALLVGPWVAMRRPSTPQ